MKVKLVCQECGKEYFCWPSSHRLFCSHACYTRSRSDDLTGKRFGRLIAIERSSNSKGGLTRWLCHCDCGNKTIVASNNLQRGNTISCGCYRIEQQKKAVITHGLTGTPIYEHWRKHARIVADKGWNGRFY